MLCRVNCKNPPFYALTTIYKYFMFVNLIYLKTYVANVLCKLIMLCRKWLTCKGPPCALTTIYKMFYFGQFNLKDINLD